MERTLLYRYLVSVTCLLLFFNNGKAICVTTFTSDTVNIACGDSFTFGSIAYYTPVTKTDTFIGIHGCDSVVTLHLNVTDTVRISYFYCGTDSIWFYGRWVDTWGQYDTLIHTSGVCDSMVILTLLLPPPGPVYVTYDTICAGDSVLFNGVYVDTAGDYNALYQTKFGCDSQVLFALTVKPAPVVTFTWDSLAESGQVDLLGGMIDTAIWTPCEPHVFLLSGGNPFGGYYSGVGVSNDTLYAWQTFQAYGYPNGFNDTITYNYAYLNGCSRSAMKTLFIEDCEGIEDIPTDFILNLYPNPAHDYLTVEYNGFTTNSQIEVVDVLGRTVKTERVKGPVTNWQVDIHALSNGMYFLRIVDDAGVESEGRPACRTGRFSVVR